MIFVLLAILFSSWLASQAFSKYWDVQKYMKQASASGWPHFFSLIHVQDPTYLLTRLILAPVTKWIPQERMRKFSPWTILLRVWHAGYGPFQEVGSDTFMLTATNGNMLITCDPTVCQQILSQTNKFKVPIEILSHIYDIYGPTLASVENEDWRRYRKVTTPYFNRETNNAVWFESVRQVDMLLHTDRDEFLVHDMKKTVAAKLLLGVIAKVLCGRDVNLEDYEMSTKLDSTSRMPFGEALSSVIRNLPIIIVTPSWIASRSPLKIHRTGHRAYIQWRDYMEEMHNEALGRLHQTTHVERKYATFLESLVAAESVELLEDNLRPLSQKEVFGNMFLFMLAGHDTGSTTAAFGTLLLALHPDCQKELQQQLDHVLGKRQPSDWNHDRDFQPLFEGYLGAVIKETLRLYSPVEFLPIRAEDDVMVTDAKSKVHCIPKGTMCIPDFAATFRHPKHWPSPDSVDGGSHVISPALQFYPSRWLNEDFQSAASRSSAWFPFGAGPRSCPGRRFAEIEICAMFASIFSQYSVELVPADDDRHQAAVHDYDEQWLLEKTRERVASSMYDGLGFSQGMYPSNHLPLRFVKRQLSAEVFE